MVLFFFWYWLPEKRSALISVISESTKNELLRYLKCNPNKIRVIHNCVSHSFLPTPASFNSHKPIFLHVGTGENKNLLRVIEALNGIPCHLRIIGRLSQAQSRSLQRFRIETSNVEGIDDDEMAREYQNCDMLVFVSTYEGFGLPIIEANATGRPVVTSNILSMPEAAGDAACFVNPFDVLSIRKGIKMVIDDSAYCNQLVQRGFKNVQRFQASTIAAQYVALYEELLKRS
jgi:glycosyltransferase involved in cell wall biosynthesis